MGLDLGKYVNSGEDIAKEEIPEEEKINAGLKKVSKEKIIKNVENTSEQMPDKVLVQGISKEKAIDDNIIE